MLPYPHNIKSVHIELTDKCQAACPMCSRNEFGGKERSHIKNTEITLEQFVQWFPREFLMKLDSFYACGNNGDPLLAKDCLEIFEYLANNTTDDCRLAIHTNGSLRNKEWWTNLARVLGNKGLVVFAIDGFKGQHEMYRRNTSWDKIIENAKTFIAAGGKARSDTLLFKHNEDEAENLKEYLLSIGFEEVILKPTQRFHGLPQFPVKDQYGNVEYYIEGPTKPQYKEYIMQPNMVKLVEKETYNALIKNSEIDPKCQTGRDLFVNTFGNVWPCCFVQALNVTDGLDWQGAEYVIRERLRLSAVDVADDIGIPNLHGTNIVDVLNSCGWGESLPKHYTTDKKLVCVKSCSTNLRKLVEDNNKPQIQYW
jgi:sulfatase maturation enzyme AslB (radical SAM superfamily)